MIRVLIFWLLSLFALESFAEEPEKKELRLFSKFGKNIGDSFTGNNVLFHLGAVVSTHVSMKSGWDAQVYDTYKHSHNEATWPGAVLASGAGALVSGVWLYSGGDEESKGAAYVIAQSTLITAAYVKMLKLVTGRAHPTHSSPLTSQEQAELWGFWKFQTENGYGWPSGHVSHTVAVMSGLAHYYPSKNWIPWLGVGLSAYMLYTVSAHNWGQMHWFSDGVAGGLMGYAIGSSVGKNLRSELEGGSEKTSSVSWAPLLSREYWGAWVGIQF